MEGGGERRSGRDGERERQREREREEALREWCRCKPWTRTKG